MNPSGIAKCRRQNRSSYPRSYAPVELSLHPLSWHQIFSGTDLRGLYGMLRILQHGVVYNNSRPQSPPPSKRARFLLWHQLSATPLMPLWSVAHTFSGSLTDRMSQLPRQATCLSCDWLGDVLHRANAPQSLPVATRYKLYRLHSTPS